MNGEEFKHITSCTKISLNHEWAISINLPTKNQIQKVPYITIIL